MRIGSTDFPEPLLNALRDGRLVVFAGAGVSMGPPANLPSFRELAHQIAEGTRQTIGEFEPEDKRAQRPWRLWRLMTTAYGPGIPASSLTSGFATAQPGLSGRR
jgi:hypothetical protein